jgi:2-iminobutanoate/2-iminopropanoate deaminase
MARKQVVTLPVINDLLKKAKVPLSPAVKANGFVFVSGTPPWDPKTGKIVRGNIEEQTALVMENLKAVLEAAGSSMDKVVKCTIFIANSAYYDTVNAIYGRYFPHDPPARTFATVGSWPWEFDIEIECIALAD